MCPLGSSLIRLRCFLALAYPVRLMNWASPAGKLLKRDTALILGEPHVETLECGVEGSSDVDVACAAERLLEIAIELEHVAEILRTWKTEAAIRLRCH